MWRSQLTGPRDAEDGDVGRHGDVAVVIVKSLPDVTRYLKMRGM